MKQPTKTNEQAVIVVKEQAEMQQWKQAQVKDSIF